VRDAPGILRRCSAVLADLARRQRRRCELRGGGGGDVVEGEGDEVGAACQPLSKEEAGRADAAHSTCRCVLAVLARVLLLQLPSSGGHAVWPQAIGDGGEGEEDSDGSGTGDGAVAAARPPGPGDWEDLWAAVAAVGGCGELKSLALLALALVEARRCIARAGPNAGAGAAPSGEMVRARLLLDRLWGIMLEEATLVAAAPYPDARTASEIAAERGGRLAAARDRVRGIAEAREAAVLREIAGMSQALPSQSRQQWREQQQQQELQQQQQQLQQTPQLQELLQQLQQLQEKEQEEEEQQQCMGALCALMKELGYAEEEEEEEEQQPQPQLEEAKEECGDEGSCGRSNEEQECQRWAQLFPDSPALIAALHLRNVFTCSTCTGQGPPPGPPSAWVDPLMDGSLAAMARTPGAASPGGGLACWLAAAADAIEVAHADNEALGAGECHVYYDPLVPPGWLPAAVLAGARPGQGEAAEAKANTPAGRQRRRCAFCGATAADGAQLRRCAGCGPVTGVRYCSQACCRNHWVRAGHRRQCEEAQRRLRAQEGLQESARSGLT
jgi:hypothetical protein